MSLAPGSRLGPYLVGEALGAGGMGEVFRARDTQLNREVAIKILPPAFADDADRLMRFEREAQTLASLNHPHIAQVYGLERSGDLRALVMELVEGDDLSQILARGPVPVQQALSIARQIAEGLESAHERGIVHRDLKPANVKVRDDGAVKVLDFGLAKAREPSAGGSASPLANSPTVTSPALTRMGVILGTAAYMAPEQARGKPVDKRADVWAFGVVLFEMLSGRAPFAGDTVTDLLSAVVSREPDWAHLPAATPAPVVQLLRRCLEKDVNRRLRDIGEARILLEAPIEVSTGSAPVAHARGPRAAILLAWAVALVMAAAAGLLWTRRAPPAAASAALTYRIPIEGLSLERAALPVLSADGRRLLYAANRALWVRDLDELEPREVRGVTDARLPFWSPDGRQIAFVQDGALWRIPVEGGRPVMVAATRFNMGSRTPGGVWRADGSIVFAPSATGSDLLTVSEQGGEFTTLYPRDQATESDFHRPSLLPDGRGLLFIVDRFEGGANTIGVLSNGVRRDVLTLERDFLDSPVYSRTGHILYHRETTAPGIWAVPFSLERLETIGAPFLVVPSASWPAVTPDGTLVYADGQLTGLMQLAWAGGDGELTPAFSETFPGIFTPRLSPDGQRLAAITAGTRVEGTITIFDLRRQTRAVLGGVQHAASELAWMGPDRLVVSNGPLTGGDLAIRGLDDRAEERIAAGMQPDATGEPPTLTFARVTAGAGGDIWHVRGGAPELLFGTPHAETYPALAPDGAHLAYTSNETGQLEVFLRTYPAAGAKTQVSSKGGQYPRWSPRGDRLLYRDLMGGLMEVAVTRRPVLALGPPRAVPLAHAIETYPGGFDLAPDGRLLVVRSVPGGAAPALVVRQRWKR